MYCPKCGTKNEAGAQYCANCGGKLFEVAADTSRAEHQSPKRVFYSESWPRAKTTAIAVVPTYDLMADEENFYVIKLPSSSAPVWGFFIGLFVARFIGMLIGAAIGEAIAVAKRKSARNSYINENHNLISSEYTNYIFIKIPLKELKHHISFEKEKFLIVKYNEGKITLRRGKEQYTITKDYLNKYVL